MIIIQCSINLQGSPKSYNEDKKAPEAFANDISIVGSYIKDTQDLKKNK